eukprot:g326.t1
MKKVFQKQYCIYKSSTCTHFQTEQVEKWTTTDPDFPDHVKNFPFFTEERNDLRTCKSRQPASHNGFSTISSLRSSKRKMSLAVIQFVLCQNGYKMFDSHVMIRI